MEMNSSAETWKSVAAIRRQYRNSLLRQHQLEVTG
jgi:hypothetical protein